MNRQPLWIAVLAAALAVSASPPAAQAAAATSVSAGDRIHVATAICSLAYAYRSTTNGHTYAITAAHCQQPGSTTARTDTGATGTFTRAALDPAGSGGTDFALLDFERPPAPAALSTTGRCSMASTGLRPVRRSAAVRRPPAPTAEPSNQHGGQCNT